MFKGNPKLKSVKSKEKKNELAYQNEFFILFST